MERIKFDWNMAEYPQQNIDQKTFKMRVITLVTIIGGTISICMTIAIYVGSLQTSLTKDEVRLNQNDVDIRYIKDNEIELWKETRNIHNEIDRKCSK